MIRRSALIRRPSPARKTARSVPTPRPARRLTPTMPIPRPMNPTYGTRTRKAAEPERQRRQSPCRARGRGAARASSRSDSSVPRSRSPLSASAAPSSTISAPTATPDLERQVDRLALLEEVERLVRGHEVRRDADQDAEGEHLSRAQRPAIHRSRSSCPATTSQTGVAPTPAGRLLECRRRTSSRGTRR